MKSNLIAVKRTDVNGKTTTRWVKAGADNKPAPRGIPSPKSQSSKERASRCRLALFPETQTYDDTPGEEYAVTINGNETFYSPAFAQQMIERLPARTLSVLEEALETLPDGKAKQMVAQSVYDMIREMSDMAGTAAAPLILKEQARIISNTCVFSDTAAVMSRIRPDSSISDHMFALDVSLQAYENDGWSRGNPQRSETDYGVLAQKAREKAQNYVMADQLHRAYGDSVEMLPEGAGDLVGEYRGQWERLSDVVRERGFQEDSVRSVMDNEVAALADGSL